MNDIERQIEGVEEEETNEEVVLEEEDTIKHKLNRNRDDDKKKKIVMYIVIGILVAVLVALLVYIVLDNRNIDDNTGNDNENNEVVNGEVQDSPDNTENDNLGYVACDDNTALLNVRNSTSGNIIDGLSCYKEVTILEELDGTDVCDKWYRINYDKKGSNYTGYACGTYIKKLEVGSSIMESVRNIIDKANDYYENSVLKAYCGTSSGSKTIDFDNNMTGEYVKSQYKDIEELKNYLLSFLDDDLIDIKLELSDIDNPKYYDNYYEIDGSLYCRNYAGKGWITYYTGNYDVEITSYSDNKITLNIAYEYINENSDCELDKLSSCSNSDFVYEIGKVTIENGVITKMDFHK